MSNMDNELYTVRLDGNFEGYAWAVCEDDAIIKVAGDAAFNEDGTMDLSYTAAVEGIHED